MKILLLFLLTPLLSISQNTIGLPDVINYSKQAYSAGLQTWDIKQDKKGIMYFANNEGLISFDGKSWKLYPLPNKTIVRSVAIGIDQKIYVGGQDELGFFSPNVNGELQYNSLTKSLALKDRSFGDVWDIVPFNNNVFFRSTHKIFKFANEAVATYNAASEWSYLGLSNGKLYAHEYQSGLLNFHNDSWIQVQNSSFPLNEIVTAIVAINTETSIITTLKNGLYHLTAAGVSPYPIANNQLFKTERIYAAIPVNKNWIALGTSNSGVYIVDHSGNIIQSFSKTEGLQNSNVLSTFLDNQGNLWLGLDNGIDFIAYNSAIKHITSFVQAGSGYTASIYNNRLYAGTSNRLYSVGLQPMEDLSFSKGNFQPVENTTGQNWGLSIINNQLLLGHHEGAFVIKDNTAQPISNKPGFWNFVPLSNTFPTPRVMAGNYKGLMMFDVVAGQFKQTTEIPGFDESSRFVAIDNEDNYWVSHPYHGVYKINKNEAGNYKISHFTATDGLPSTLNNHVFKIKNEVVVAGEKGIYAFNNAANKFEPSAFYKKLLGNQSIRYLKEDTEGNIWFIHEKVLGVVDLSGAKPTIIYLPELNNKMLSGFEFIYPVDKSNIFVGGENGFFHINYAKYKSSVPVLTVQVRGVTIINERDSLLFGGYEVTGNDEALIKPSINNNWKTIHIEYSSTLFGYQPNLEYSYRLKGFAGNWSEWSKRSEKEFTNLPAGNYIFEVKVRSNLANESGPASYAFKILPPWYQTIWAIILYAFIIAGAFYILYKWQQKKFKKQHAKYEEEQRRLLYIHELERSKTESELIALRNEKLEAEINFKNSELASSAMHLVKKSELLTKSKTQLTQVMKGLDNPQAITDLKRMIKSLTEDDNMDKEWENFAKHFDKVHSDFLIALKEKHPTITPNELKLSAYLRMNLSTKEIAQLMNISVRGVEISRYRLRKKLGLSPETSLFDYLINFHNQPSVI